MIFFSRYFFCWPLAQIFSTYTRQIYHFFTFLFNLLPNIHNKHTLYVSYIHIICNKFKIFQKASMHVSMSICHEGFLCYPSEMIVRTAISNPIFRQFLFHFFPFRIHTLHYSPSSTIPWYATERISVYNNEYKSEAISFSGWFFFCFLFLHPFASFRIHYEYVYVYIQSVHIIIMGIMFE